jgi:hypothetical protein
MLDESLIMHGDLRNWNFYLSPPSSTCMAELYEMIDCGHLLQPGPQHEETFTLALCV